jgi:hypothetical protein
MIQRDEQRVIDALRVFNGGLTVTDQDITVAESRLRKELEPPSPRRRLILLAAAVAAVLVVGFFVSQAIDGRESSTPPADKPSPASTLKKALQANAYNLGSEDFTAGAQPTAQDLAGFWLLREPFNAPLIVDADGGWSIGLPPQAGWGGSSTLTGNTWARRFSHTECDQPRGFTLPWHAAIASDGSLRLMFTGSQNVCTPADDREVWDRVTPGSPVADYLVAVSQEADWQKAPLSFRWQGVYVAPATGHVLAVTDDETYRYYDNLTDAPLTAAEQGDSGSIGSCGGGPFTGTVEVAQIPGVADYVGSYDAVRMTSTSSCVSGVAAEDAWVKVFG